MKKMEQERRKAEEDAKISTDAIYNAGALYYNKAAEIIKAVNEMSLEDYNKRDKTEYAKADTEFKKALPYFEK
jgi:hypothetical protein